MRTIVVLVALVLLAAIARPAEAKPAYCNDYRTNIQRGDVVTDCNQNGLTDDCDTFGARFSDRRVTENLPVYQAVAAFKADADDRIDLAAAARDFALVHVLRNAGQKQFPIAATISTIAPVQELIAVDFDRDGRTDLIGKTRKNLVFIANKPTGFVVVDQPNVGQNSTDYTSVFRVGDMTGDGYPDVVISDDADKLYLYKNTGGRFTAAPTFIGAVDYGFALGDVDGDGDTDIVLKVDGTRAVQTLLNDGRGTFRAQAAVPTEIISHFLLADIDHDSKLDLIASNNNDERLLLMKGDGKGSFVFTQTIDTFLNTRRFILGDIDNDGEPDLLNVDPILAIHRIRKGIIQPGIDDSATVWTSDAALADLDNDGRKDWIVAVDGTAGLLIRWNRPSPIFDENRDGIPDECNASGFTPIVAGNSGPVTIRTIGSAVVPGSSLFLERPGGRINPTMMFPAAASPAGTFNLFGVGTGAWTLSARTPQGVTSPLGAFEIRPSDGWCMTLDVVMPDRVRAGRQVKAQVVYVNSCLEEFRGLLIDAALPPGSTINDIPGLAEPVLPPGVSPADIADVPLSYAAEDGSIHGPVIVPLIPPRSSGTIDYAITLPAEGSYSIAVSAHAMTPLKEFVPQPRPTPPPLPTFVPPPDPIPPPPPQPLREFRQPPFPPGPPPPFPDFGDCFKKVGTELGKDLLKSLAGKLGGDQAACAKDLAGLGIDMVSPVIEAARGGRAHPGIAVMKVQGAMIKAGASCAKAAGASVPPLAIAGEVISWSRKLNKYWGLAENCGPPILGFLDYVAAVVSVDPNELAGPPGQCEGRYVANTDELAYRVDVENLPTAAASAATVRVRLKFDPALVDLSTLKFGSIVLAGKTITVGSQTSNPSFGGRTFAGALATDFSATADPKSGVVSWKVEALDAATLEPIADPDLGLLPPNRNPPQGQGSFSFRVRPRAGVQGIVSASADVIFDENPPITTNTWSNNVVVPGHPRLESCPAAPAPPEPEEDDDCLCSHPGRARGRGTIPILSCAFLALVCWLRRRSLISSGDGR